MTIMRRNIILFGAVGMILLGAAGLALSQVTAQTPQPQQPALVERAASAAIPQLTDAERNKATQVALSDPRVAGLLNGRNYSVRAIAPWHTSSSLQKLGAVPIIAFEKPFQAELDWPTMEYDEEKIAFPHYRETTQRKALEVRELQVFVDLQAGRVVEMLPLSFDEK